MNVNALGIVHAVEIQPVIIIGGCLVEEKDFECPHSKLNKYYGWNGENKSPACELRANRSRSRNNSNNRKRSTRITVLPAISEERIKLRIVNSYLLRIEHLNV